MLKRREIGDSFYPRNANELSNRLESEEDFRARLEWRTATEAKIGIFKNVFLGGKLLGCGTDP